MRVEATAGSLVEQAQVEAGRKELHRQFHPPQILATRVDETLRQEVARFRYARVRDFVPVLAFRGARERLRDEQSDA